MHSLFPPLIVDKLPTKNGPKQIAIVAGISDNIYAIDVETGKLLWQRHFTIRPSRKVAVCATATRSARADKPQRPIIGPADASGARTLYAMAGNGMLHSLNVADGRNVRPPVKFGFPNGKSYALNMANGVIYTTTSQGCNGNPNQVWAIDLNDPAHKVMTFNPGSGGLWGREGASIDSTGTAWAPTGDGTYDPLKIICMAMASLESTSWVTNSN